MNVGNSFNSLHTWGRLNIKMLSYQYRDPHVKDKKVLRHLSFNMGIPLPGKDCIYIEMAPRLLCLFFHMTSLSWCWAVSSVTLTHGSRIEGHFAKVHRVFVSRNNWSLPKVLVLQISPVSLGSLLWNTDDNIEMTLVICMYHSIMTHQVKSLLACVLWHVGCSM